MRKIVTTILVAVFCLAFALSGQALAETKQYKVPVISDFTGPWAQLFKAWIPMQKSVFAWWNKTEGQQLGVELTLKHYDGRYDSSVIAGMWPGILAECNPIIAQLLRLPLSQSLWFVILEFHCSPPERRAGFLPTVLEESLACCNKHEGGW